MISLQLLYRHIRIINIIYCDSAHFCASHAGLRQDTERDVVDMNPRFTFSPNTTSSSSNFIIIDDDVYEYDELIMADFDFDRRIWATFNTMKDPLNVTYILIKDDDSEYRIIVLHAVILSCLSVCTGHAIYIYV